MRASKVMKHGPRHSWYDDRAAPVVVMRVPDVFTTEELAGALDAVVKWLLHEVDAPFGFICDFAKPLSISAHHRKMMAEAEKQYTHVDHAFNAGQAFVVGSAFTRGVVTAIYWLSPPVYPYTVVTELSEAMRWTRAQFDKFIAEYPEGRSPERRGRKAG